jgi:hypothetical protein
MTPPAGWAITAFTPVFAPKGARHQTGVNTLMSSRATRDSRFQIRMPFYTTTRLNDDRLIAEFLCSRGIDPDTMRTVAPIHPSGGW